jgi:hypothetical protein
VTLEELEQFHYTRPAQSSKKPDLAHNTMSDNAYSDNLTIDPIQNLATPYLHPRQMLCHFPSVIAAPELVTAIRNGRSVNLPEFSDAPLVKVFANQQLLLAVMNRIAGTLFQPKVVLYGSNEPLPL